MFGAVSCLASVVGGQQVIQLKLRNGSSLTAAVEAFELTWTEFRARGASQPQRYSLTSIDRLILSGSPVSEFLEIAKQLVVQLGDESYQRREEAEATLKSMLDQSANPTLKSFIEDAVNDQRLEVRFRAQRILSALVVSNQPPSSADNFDVLFLKEGRHMRGDAGEFTIAFQWRGQSFQCSRRDIAELRWMATEMDHASATGPWTPKRGAKAYIQPPEVRPGDLTEIDFERDLLGGPLERGASVDRLYADRGLLFHSDVGYIGISGYEINFEGRPPRGNSICVYDTRGSFTRRFKGVTEIAFCMPGRAAEAAGVHWFECYAARLDNPRDFVLQAFDAAGRLLATVESSDQPCGYFAVASAQPIHSVRFLSNPSLFHLKRRVDDDYAIDNVAFSSPVNVPPLHAERYRIGVRGGDVWCADHVRFGNDRTLTIEPLGASAPVTFDLEELEYLLFPGSSFPEPARNSKRWLALLADGSMVEIQADPRLQPSRPEMGAFAKEQVLAIWSARDFMRFPNQEDWAGRKYQLVFPTARISTDELSLNETRIAWDSTNARRQFDGVYTRGLEVVNENGLAVDEEPPLPIELQSLEWPEPNSGHLPTIWFADPPDAAYTTAPSVLLKNGELFVLGGKLGFQLNSLSPAGLTIVRTDASHPMHSEPMAIPFDVIQRIVF